MAHRVFPGVGGAVSGSCSAQQPSLGLNHREEWRTVLEPSGWYTVSTVWQWRRVTSSSHLSTLFLGGGVARVRGVGRLVRGVGWRASSWVGVTSLSGRPSPGRVAGTGKDAAWLKLQGASAGQAGNGSGTDKLADGTLSGPGWVGADCRATEA